jgi:hypothetical protein
MKRNFFLAIALPIAAIIAIMACTKDANEAKSYIEEKSIQSQLKFIEKDIDVLNNVTQSYSVSSTDDGVGLQIRIIIVSWDWGRPSKHCRGFGFCNVTWFPVLAPLLATLQNNEYTGWSTLEYDEADSEYYLELLLAEPLPSNLLADSVSLYIDNDMFLPIQNISTVANNSSLINYSNFIIDEGKYDFIPDLGEYGGYKIIFRKE